MVNLERLLRDILFPSCPHTLFPDHEVSPELDPFPQDVQIDLETVDVNTLIKPVLLQYYQHGWDLIR